MSKYIYIGSRIYYLKINGNVILRTNEGEGHLIEVTPEQDWEIYSELKKYDKEAVDYIQLEYNQYSTEFRECTGYHIDIDKKEIVFEYGEKPDSPDIPQTPSLHERMDTQEARNSEQDDLLFEQSYEIAMLKLNSASNSSLE